MPLICRMLFLPENVCVLVLLLFVFASENELTVPSGPLDCPLCLPVLKCVSKPLLSPAFACVRNGCQVQKTIS